MQPPRAAALPCTPGDALPFKSYRHSCPHMTLGPFHHMPDLIVVIVVKVLCHCGHDALSLWSRCFALWSWCLVIVVMPNLSGGHGALSPSAHPLFPGPLRPHGCALGCRHEGDASIMCLAIKRDRGG